MRAALLLKAVLLNYMYITMAVVIFIAYHNISQPSQRTVNMSSSTQRYKDQNNCLIPRTLNLNQTWQIRNRM